MSLPAAFENPEDYFHECLQFFDEYKYLYNVSNIDILTQGVLTKIEINEDNIDIFEDNIDLTEIDDPFLKKLFSKLKRLQFFYEDIQCEDVDLGIPASKKKMHEIVYLAKEIKGLCENAKCDVVVDLGSGLGYLDQHIFEATNYRVLCIDCNDNHHFGAKKRQRKYHGNSLEKVKHVKHTISRDSHVNIQDFLQNKFGDVHKFCITGLHACADLTIDAIDIFLKMENAKVLAIMPCCYHKMCIENGGFKSFPLSECLKNALERFNGKENLGVPFMRLAAHPQSVDDNLKDLVFNSLSRAILQLYAHTRNCKVKRNKRKPVNIKTIDNDFYKYAENAIRDGFTIVENEGFISKPFDIEELKTLWNEMAPILTNKAGIYIALQNYLQPVIENFVLYDRLMYVKENGIENCKFQKILNDKISPRCLVLVAYKNR